MKPIHLSMYLSAALMIVGVPLSGCSAETSSGSVSLSRPSLDETGKFKRLFEDCVIGRVLAGADMEDSKTLCLIDVQKSCNLAPNLPEQENQASLPNCLEVVSKDNEFVIRNGKHVECDSGYCTIVF